MSAITPITNQPLDYAWGSRGGVSRLLGWPAAAAREAELWLGAHPASPSRAISDDNAWTDLRQWEQSQGTSLNFLLKVLSAEAPLSLQAHPNEGQAREGYDREERLGIAIDDPVRNYRDRFAKPEIIVAAEDGFEALCGFQPPGQTITWLDQLAGFGLGAEAAGLRGRLAGPDPLRAATAWALSGDPAARRLAEELTLLSDHYPHRFGTLRQLATHYPGDPGLLVALATNHVVLDKGEALWLPAGNIHAYLRGTGIELMGPSDNVLRGGLTKKHVDVSELLRVVDFSPIAPPRLMPEVVVDNVVTYRPSSQPSGRGVPFQLLRADGDAVLRIAAPSVALCTLGSFEMTIDDARVSIERGAAAFIDGAGVMSVAGRGALFIATGSGASPSDLGVLGPPEAIK